MAAKITGQCPLKMMGPDTDSGHYILPPASGPVNNPLSFSTGWDKEGGVDHGVGGALTSLQFSHIPLGMSLPSHNLQPPPSTPGHYDFFQELHSSSPPHGDLLSHLLPPDFETYLSGPPR